MGRKKKSQLTGSAGVFFKRISPKKQKLAEPERDEIKVEIIVQEEKLWKKTPEWRPLI
ncbi:hypothetical protein HOC99_00345 [Candidatus Woesearchaeota archaeon]|jgi:hypothetical protein|nr:hypothetical protein [Candidatus Woesearchaeota archaeon]MBT4387521.1 hypothetical protein [Candidatus Woesearchaeota archaeon]MBT4595363.1 hypothetical protein [Candidatus Woesearchaeota archaeon]MBT5741232.1 hypothetical protein [Candidatus Woesearchaeota archaeon]MBT7849629.1 hypothetical protein [Candidatus Woesearchaeota archaeon]